MKQIVLVVGVFLAWALASGSVLAREAVVPDSQELVTLKKGFGASFKKALALPVIRSDAAFVVQDGKLHVGMWAWRAGKFIVLRNAADPGSDVPLDPNSPSCQVHVQNAPEAWNGVIRFQPMLFSGRMSHGQASLYTAVSEGDEATFMSCLTAVSAKSEPTPFRVGDLRNAFHPDRIDIVGN